MTISPEKQKQLEEITVEIAGLFGKLVGSLIATAIAAGIFYAILHYLVALPITYLQVLGVILTLDLIKSFLKK